MSLRICSDCGFYRGKNHAEVCIAKQEERKQPGYRPGFKDPKPRPADEAQENIQSSARRR